MQRWAINAIASGLMPDIIVDSDHMIEYLKYAATRKLFDKKGDERSANQRLSAVSTCFVIHSTDKRLMRIIPGFT
jgi:hypothetical protein